jgi:hypothetical protein
MSARPSISGLDCHCSGDMYGAVPMIMPVEVSLSSTAVGSPRSLATPKDAPRLIHNQLFRRTAKCLQTKSFRSGTIERAAGEREGSSYLPEEARSVERT